MSNSNNNKAKSKSAVTNKAAVAEPSNTAAKTLTVQDFIYQQKTAASKKSEQPPQTSNALVNQVKEWFLGITSALESLHQRNITHNNIMPSSLILVPSKSSSTVKLAKFGIGFEYMLDVLTEMEAFIAPEVFEDDRFSKQSDVFALGVTLLTVLALRDLDVKSDEFNADQLKTELIKVYGAQYASLFNTLVSCVQLDPLERPTTAEILEEFEPKVEHRGSVAAELDDIKLSSRSLADESKDEDASEDDGGSYFAESQEVALRKETQDSKKLTAKKSSIGDSFAAPKPAAKQKDTSLFRLAEKSLVSEAENEDFLPIKASLSKNRAVAGLLAMEEEEGKIASSSAPRANTYAQSSSVHHSFGAPPPPPPPPALAAASSPPPPPMSAAAAANSITTEAPKQKDMKRAQQRKQSMYVYDDNQEEEEVKKKQRAKREQTKADKQHAQAMGFDDVSLNMNSNSYSKGRAASAGKSKKSTTLLSCLCFTGARTADSDDEAEAKASNRGGRTNTVTSNNNNTITTTTTRLQVVPDEPPTVGVSSNAKDSILDLQLGNEKKNKYRTDKLIGKGGQSSVFLVTEDNTRKKYIMKKYKLQAEDEFEQELKALQKMEHRNIVHLVDHFAYSDDDGDVHKVLILEYCEKGDYQRILKLSKKKVSSFRVLLFMKQMLEALAYIHARAYVHRDLKPANLFVTSKNDLRIGDFGFAMQSEEKNAPAGGTLVYMSMEQRNEPTVYNPMYDIWATGTIFVELMSKKQRDLKLLLQESDLFVEETIWNRELKPKGYLDCMLQILKGCLNPNAMQRWTSDTAAAFATRECENYAAVMCQKMFRGYKVRKMLKRNK